MGHCNDLPLETLGRMHGQHLHPSRGGRHFAGGEAVLALCSRVQVIEQFFRPGPGGGDLGDDISERIQVRPARR